MAGPGLLDMMLFKKESGQAVSCMMKRKELRWPLFSLVLFEPTGVAKTACSLALGQSIASEIINGDMGQLYQQLSIGTAKPDWKNEPITHHLFDVLKHQSTTQLSATAMIASILCPLLAQKGIRPLLWAGPGSILSHCFSHQLMQPKRWLKNLQSKRVCLKDYLVGRHSILLILSALSIFIQMIPIA